MEFEIIKFLMAHTPKWVGAIVLGSLGVNLVVPTIKKVIDLLAESRATKKTGELIKDYQENLSYLDEEDRMFFEEVKAQKRFYEHTGIWCNKNLRHGLQWLFDKNRAHFSWDFLRPTKRYLREENERFYVKIPWIDVFFEHFFYASAILYLLVFAACLCLAQSRKIFLLNIFVLFLLFLIFFSFSLLNATAPVWRARRIAEEIKIIDPNPDNYSEIPKLFDPIYGTEHSLIKPHHIETLKSLLSYVKRIKHLPRKP